MEKIKYLKFKVGDSVTVKTEEELRKDLEYKPGIGFADPISGVVFIDAMKKNCGKKKVIKKVTRYNSVDLYYFGPDPRMDFAYVESFLK
jgi:hypothetical protein